MSAPRAALLLLVALALSGCGGDTSYGPLQVVPDDVKELTNVLQLRADFEADAGKTRVLFLFSPT